MPFDALPIWGVFVATAAVVVAGLEIGFRFGHWQRQRGAGKSDMAGAMIGAVMGLLAFMLAFTFNAAATRHEARKALVIKDANAIERTWLRADLLPEAQRAEVQGRLREYVDLRLKATVDGADVGAALERSDVLQREMWTIAAAVGRAEPGSIMGGLFVEALNEMNDVQLERLTMGTRNRVPGTIWVALYGLTAIGMMMIGIQVGLGGARQAAIALALALSFSIVLFLIADLDRPQQGLVNVSQQAMTELQVRLRSQH